MSDNNLLDSFLKPPSHAGSSNAGTWEANQGYAASPQQSHESAESYATRMSAYNYTKQQNESK